MSQPTELRVTPLTSDCIFSHVLIGSTYTNRVLAIESDTGEIYVNADNAFDYDTVNPIFVQVRAIDKANHTATVPLTINLLDVNNKAPTISVVSLFLRCTILVKELLLQ